jgi:hypothetical protein
MAWTLRQERNSSRNMIETAKGKQQTWHVLQRVRGSQKRTAGAHSSTTGCLIWT